jgi:hypothetical protein
MDFEEMCPLVGPTADFFFWGEFDAVVGQSRV